jgi:hypothetical protein
MTRYYDECGNYLDVADDATPEEVKAEAVRLGMFGQDDASPEVREYAAREGIDLDATTAIGALT